MEGFVAALAALDGDTAALELSRLRKDHPDLVVQMVSMARIPNARAIRMVAAQTMRALETGALLASKSEVDLLLRLAGTTQIAEAVDRIGYHQRKGGTAEAGVRTLQLVAAGPAASVDRLSGEIAVDGRYSILEETPLADEEDATLVEEAALLGASV